MLVQYGGYPAFELMYDRGGHLVDPAAEAEVVAYLASDAGIAITDLFVISHGWNNDIGEARDLYHNFFNAFAAVPPELRNRKGRKVGVVAIFWPSKRFADSAAIPGGAAGLSDPALPQVLAQLDLFKDMCRDVPDIDAKISHLKTLAPLLSISANAQDDYVSTLASLVPKPRYESDEGMDNARLALDSTPGRTVLANLAVPLGPTTAPLPGSGGASGLIGGVIHAAATLGDLVTFYTMKDRAGIVGRTGVVQTLRALLKARAAPPRIHIVGHSFGARVVTSAANALNGAATNESVDSMSLLQGAYSHNGLSQNWDGQNHAGGFRSVISQTKVRGPILISHSVHDFPVGTAYPLASRLRGQTADALVGGPDDIYGGMGRNGAQHTIEVFKDVPLAAVANTAAYPQAPADACWILNICGDGPPPAPTITAHGDIAKPELVAAILHYI